MYIIDLYFMNFIYIKNKQFTMRKQYIRFIYFIIFIVIGYFIIKKYNYLKNRVCAPGLYCYDSCLDEFNFYIDLCTNDICRDRCRDDFEKCRVCCRNK